MTASPTFARARRRAARLIPAALYAMPLAGAAQCGGNGAAHQSLLELLRHGMVKLESRGGPDIPCRSESTGFIVGADAGAVHIATARHALPRDAECAAAGTKLYAKFPQAPEQLVELTLRAESPIDIALYRAPVVAADSGGSKALACPLRLGQRVSPIDQVVLFGYFPGDTKQALPYDGRIDADPVGHKQRVCATINKANSGGPVVGAEGQVVGIVIQRMEEDIYGNKVNGQGWIVPVDEARAVFREVLGPQKPDDPYCNKGGLTFPLRSAASTEQTQPLAQSIEVPYTLARMRNDHDPLRAEDAVRWALAQAQGEKDSQIRYPRSYTDEFEALPGYLFRAVSGTSVVSRNRPSEPVPTTGCESKEDCIRFSDDRRKMIVDHRLWSGPRGIDETRGWIEMIIKTTQVKQ